MVSPVAFRVHTWAGSAVTGPCGWNRPPSVSAGTGVGVGEGGGVAALAAGVAAPGAAAAPGAHAAAITAAAAASAGQRMLIATYFRHPPPRGPAGPAPGKLWA